MFLKAFMQELNPDENEKLIDHTLVCKKCHQKFEILRQLSEELTKTETSIGERELTKEEEKDLRNLAKIKLKGIKGNKSLPFKLVPIKYLAAAAALLIVIAGLFYISKINQREIYREGERKEDIKLIKPSGLVKKVPVIFSWTAYEGVDDYTFELIDENLTTVYEKDFLMENQLTLPEEVRRKLKKGMTYVWKVEAKNEFGKVLSAASTSFELE